MNQNQQNQQNQYHQNMFNYIMDAAPYQQEMKNDTLPFVTSFGKTVYNQAQLVDIESNLKGQTILNNRCDNHLNSNLGSK